MTAHFPSTAEKELPPHLSIMGWRHQKRYGLYSGGLKRGLYVLAVLFSLPVILPLIMVLALLISMDGQSPLYRQKRLGSNGRIFTLWKLRSMVAGADTRLEAYLSANPAARAEWTLTQKLKNDQCIDGIGRVLRKSLADNAGTGAALPRSRLLRAALRDHWQLAAGRFRPAMTYLVPIVPASTPLMSSKSQWRPILPSCWPPSDPCCAVRSPEEQAQTCCARSALSPC